MGKIEYTIRPLLTEEWEMAMQLAWDTFLIYEAPEYSKEGIKNFEDFVKDPRLKQMFINGDFQGLGAFKDGTIIGILGSRGQHVSLLFVDPVYHHQGIASSLLKTLFEKGKRLNYDRMTVNSSPYAVDFYRKLGFTKVTNEQTKDGIRFTPMMVNLHL